MENNDYRVSSNEEMSTIMSDIEKYTQEEIEAGNLEDQNTTKNKSYPDPRVDGMEEDPGVEIEATEIEPEDVIEEEFVNEADLFKEKYYNEKRKRKSLYADRQNLETENKELKKILDGTLNNNVELYGRDLYNDLEKIKNIKKQALLGEDADLLLEAEDIYHRTLYKINEFENSVLNNNSQIDRQNNEIDNESDSEYLRKEELTRKTDEWLSERPELVEGSSKFNPRIQEELGSFMRQFDYALQKNGREDEILSDEYLDVLDEYINRIKVTPKKDGYVTSKVGGVRNNFSTNGSGGGNSRIVLSAFDKDYAKNLGISEKEYLKYKIEDIKESRNSR